MKKTTQNAASQPQPQMRMVSPEAQAAGGNAERSPATERGNQTRTQPENPATAAIPADSPAAPDFADVMKRHPSLVRKGGLLSTTAAETGSALANKLAHTQQARQLLAEANDLYQASGDESEKANETAARAAFLLYQDRVNGALSADELSSLLGDIFGYKAKGKSQSGASYTTRPVPKDFQSDGVTASKTPFGKGEDLRKRIVRLVQGHAYVNQTDDVDVPKFYEGVDKSDVKAVLERVDATDDGTDNALSLWSAYDKLTKIKREGGTTRRDPAFDTKAIAKIVASLSQDGAADLIASDRPLLQAYGALLSALLFIDDMTASEAA